MKKLLLLIFLMMHSLLTGQSEWETLGQGGGGNIVDVVCHPTDPSIVWVVTDLTGIFRSTDGGKTYDHMSGPLEKEEELFEWIRGMDHELVYDPTDPSIMYWAMDAGIYTEPGLYKSTNGGDSWFKIPGSPDLSPAAITVDYNGVIYGVKHRNLYVSTDKGSTWIKKPDLPTYYCQDDYFWRRFFRIIIYSTRDNRIFIGDRREGTGLFFSEDMGDSWTQVLQGNEIMDIAASPVTHGLVMALEQDGRIFRSADGGKHFEKVGEIDHSYYRWRKWPAYYGGIAINRDDHVMAVGRHELAVSTDAGTTFTKIKEDECDWDPGEYIFPDRRTNKNLFKCNKLAASPASKTWFFVDGHMNKMSSDNGKSWKACFKGVDILCVYCPPVVDVTNPDVIHVGAGDNGHYYTMDSGKSWKTSEPTMSNIDGIAQDPNNPMIFYKFYGAKRDRGSVYKSTDGGVTWKKLTNVPLPHIKGRTMESPQFYSGFIGRMQVDPTNSQRIFICHRGSAGLYMSEDGGQNFKNILDLVRPWE